MVTKISVWDVLLRAGGQADHMAARVFGGEDGPLHGGQEAEGIVGRDQDETSSKRTSLATCFPQPGPTPQSSTIFQESINVLNPSME
jgi:hypothetical protein